LLSQLPTQNAAWKTEWSTLLLWKPQDHHFICNISPLDPVLSNINPFTTLISCFSHTHTHLNINSQFMSSLPFKFPDLNVAWLCHLYHACYMPCSGSPRFADTRGLYWTVQIMKFLIKQFPATPCQFLTLIQTFPLAHCSQIQVSTVHSELLWVGWSVIWSPVGEQRVFVLVKPVQTGPGAHPASSNGWGYSCQHMAPTTPSQPAAGLRQSTGVPLLLPSWHVIWRVSPFYPIFQHLQSVLVC